MPVRRDSSKIYLYQLSTLGLYFIYWCARSGKEVNKELGKQAVPTAWWLIVPFGAYWWMWQYTDAISDLSAGKIKQNDTFLLFVLVSAVWWLILDNIQSLPTDLAKLFLPSSWVNAATFIIVYLAVILLLGFFCAFVQNKLNSTRLK